MKRIIRKAIIIILIAALLIGTAGVAIWRLTASVNDSSDPFVLLSEGFTDRKIVDESSALAAIEDVAEVLGIENVNAELSNCEVTTVSSNTYYRFQQEYEGISVYGRSVVVVADESGSCLSLSGNYLNNGNLDISPKVDKKSAIEIIQEHYGEDAVIRNEGLSIYSLNNSTTELAWKIYVGDYNTNKYCFVSANNGTIIAELPLVCTEQVLCSGSDVDGENQDFYAEYENGKYIMEDTVRDISVYDANNSTLQIEFLIMDSNNKLYHSDGINFFDEDNNIVYITGENFSYLITDEQGNIIGTDGETVARLWTDNIFTEVTPVTNDSTTWDNAKAVTLMSRLSTIYEFWKSEFERNSYDNKYGAIVAVYDDYKNVGWFVGDTQNAASFGSPNIPITILSFGTDNSLSLDTIAHEFMHSVERSISAMNYEAESGALMEAYSDIFGEIVEDWSNDGVLNNNCDWIHNRSRNMILPNQSDSALPDTYRGDYWVDVDDISNENDYGGVHTNNTVISHAAYLMWKGIDGSDAFEPLSTEELANLFYETLYTLPSDCTFAQFRALVQNTAEYQDLSNKQRLCISNAFFQVGITSAAMPVAKDHLAVDVYGIDGLPYNDYTLHVRHGNTENTYDGEIVKAEGITFPESGEYQLCVVDNANTDNQTTVTILAVERGGAKTMPIFTECGVSKPDGSIGTGEGELPSIDYNNLVAEAYTETYTDEFGTYVWRIPKIMLSGDDVESINNEIWETLFTGAVSQNHEGIQQGDTFVAYDVIDYTWAVNGGILSLVITTNASTMSWTDYYVYNVDVTTGSELSRDTLLNTYGYSLDEYYKLAEQVLGSKFWSGWDRDNENFQNNSFTSWFNDALQKTIAQENIDQSFPYINDKGELCIIAKVYSLAGADYYWNNLNMVNFTLVPDYATPVESNTHTSNISGAGWAEAYKSILLRHPDTTSFTYSSNTSYIDTEYTVYDIDKNGTPELIVKEDISDYYVYSFNGTDVVASDPCYWSYDDCLYEYEGNGIVVHSGGMGSMRIEDASLYSMVNDKLEWTETLMSTEECSFDGLYSFLDGLTPINDFHPITDDSYLSN